MNKKLFGWSLLYIGIGIGLGAFGTHGLKNLVEPEQLSSYKTGIQYQFLAGTILLILSTVWEDLRSDVRITVPLIAVGSLLFSFSIYTLVVVALPPGLKRIVVMLTPLGGLSMIIGVCWLGIKMLKKGDFYT